MRQRPTLEAIMADIANRFRFGGIASMFLAGIAFLFSAPSESWPLDWFSVVLIVLFAIGSTLLFCGQLMVRKIVGFGTMEPPPITMPKAKG